MKRQIRAWTDGRLTPREEGGGGRAQDLDVTNAMSAAWANETEEAWRKAERAAYFREKMHELRKKERREKDEKKKRIRRCSRHRRDVIATSFGVPGFISEARATFAAWPIARARKSSELGRRDKSHPRGRRVPDFNARVSDTRSDSSARVNRSRPENLSFDDSVSSRLRTDTRHEFDGSPLCNFAPDCFLRGIHARDTWDRTSDWGIIRLADPRANIGQQSWNGEGN